MEYLVAEYEQIVSYLMGGIADTDELAKKLDEAFATIEQWLRQADVQTAKAGARPLFIEGGFI